MIDSFDGQYAFLSNFWAHPVKFEGREYPSTEHAYQAAKFLDEEKRAKIAGLKTAKEAKRAGKWKGLRPDWDAVKLQVMETVLREKFKDPQLKEQLLATEKEELREGNWWGDTYWGVCKGEGLNHLGKLLMKIRAEYAAKDTK